MKAGEGMDSLAEISLLSGLEGNEPGLESKGAQVRKGGRNRRGEQVRNLTVGSACIGTVLKVGQTQFEMIVHS